MKKICFKCGVKKDLSMFYKHNMMADGHLNKCKECAKQDSRTNRSRNIDYYLEYDKCRSMLPGRVEARKNYLKTESGKKAARRAKTKWLESNTIKRAAQILVGNAVRGGKLTKPKKCECGYVGRIHGHHDDYSKPLEVRWLCSKCHSSWHKLNKPING